MIDRLFDNKYGEIIASVKHFLLAVNANDSVQMNFICNKHEEDKIMYCIVYIVKKSMKNYTCKITLMRVKILYKL